MKKVYASAILIAVLGCSIYPATRLGGPEQSEDSSVVATEAITSVISEDSDSNEQQDPLDNSTTNRSQAPIGARPLAHEEILVKYEMATEDCQTKDVTTGLEVRTKTTCTVSLTFDHPYDAFSFEQLMQIHETDPVASYLLGMKTFHDVDWQDRFDYETSVNHLYRAAYLSGKAQPYLDMLKSRGLGGLRAPSSETALRENYVWYEAGIRSGVISTDDEPDWMEPMMSAVPAETVRLWDAEANNYAEHLRNSRAYKTGNSFQ